MHRMLSIKLDDLNQYLTCPLCKGYLVDSYTVNECLHSFCKSCIIKYVRRHESCPVCKIEIMKDKIKSYLKRDLNLQYIVYKLVPDLFKNEMKRRRTFFSTNPKAIKYRSRINIKDKEALGLLEEDVFSVDEHSDISLSIEYSETGLPEICDSQRNKELDPSIQKSYLLCPPSFTIEHLKKFLCLKTGSTSTQKIDIMYDDKPLSKDLTLIDIAYIYAWRRSAPMRLFYRTAKGLEGSEKPNVLAEINNLPSEPVKAATVEAAAAAKAPVEPPVPGDEENKENVPDPCVSSISEIISKTDEAASQDETSQALTSTADECTKTNQTITDEFTASHSINPTSAHHHDMESTMNDVSHNLNDITDNHTQSINEQEHLTITGMVASISKESTRQPSVKIEPTKAVSSSRVSLSNVEIVSNSDKENEGRALSLAEDTHSSKSDGTEPSSVGKNESESGFNSMELSSNLTSGAVNSIEDTKEKKQPKKRDQSKKNLSEANSNVMLASNENSNEAMVAKKKMKMTASEDAKPKKLKKPKSEPRIVEPSQDSDARSIASLESSSVSSYNPHQQTQQPTAHHHHQLPLPFANKLNTTSMPGHQLPGLQPNFQMTPMALLNQLSSWKTLAEQQQQQQQQQQQAPQPPNNYMANYSAHHFFQEYTKQANSMAAQVLLSQKYPPASIIEYFQTKAAQSLQNQNFFNVYNHANLHAHHHHHQAPPATTASSQQYFNNLDEFKKPIANFASLIQETYQNNLNPNTLPISRMTHSNSNSSLHSTCNDNSSLDSLKETQLRISESCNLVNESN